MDKAKLEQAILLNNKIDSYEDRIERLISCEEFDIKITEAGNGRYHGGLSYGNEEERSFLEEIKARILEFLEKRKAELEQEFKSM